jgi:hypothetical protein
VLVEQESAEEVADANPLSAQQQRIETVRSLDTLGCRGKREGEGGRRWRLMTVIVPVPAKVERRPR